MRNTTLLVSALSLASPLALLAQRPAADSARLASPATGFDFSIKNIMRGPELYGTPPTDIRWSPDSRWIYFNWVAPGESWRTAPTTYRVRAVAGSKPEKLSLEQRDSAGPYIAQTTTSGDSRLGTAEYSGDIYTIDYRSGSARRLTHTTARESNPVLSTDGKRVYFVRDDNAFSIDLASGLTAQLTDLRTGTEPADTSAPKTTQRIRLAQQQRDLFAVVREHIAEDSIAKADRRTLDSLRNPKPVYVGRCLDDTRPSCLRIGAAWQTCTHSSIVHLTSTSCRTHPAALSGS